MSMNVDGSAAAALVTPEVDEGLPVWSPDGKWVAANTGNCDLIALNVAGAPSIKVSDRVPGVGGGGTCPDGPLTWR
jgi:Tol biopolymer transport system component